MKLTGKFFLRALGLLLPVYIAGAATAQPASAKPLTFDDYNRLITQYRFSIPDSAIYYARKGLQYCRNNNDLKGQGIILNHWGIIDENQGRFAMGKQKYLMAIKAFKKINFTEGIGDETIRLGVTEMRQANFDKAIGYFLEALKLHERSGSQKGIMECYDVLGEAYMGQNNWKVALGYLHKGEELSRKLPLSGITLYIYNNLGVTYTNTGQIAKALPYFKKALKLSEVQQYSGLHVTLLNSLAMAYTKAGYKEKAIQLQHTALAQARAINNYLRVLQTLNGLADSYTDTDPDRALGYLKEALILAQQKNAAKVRMETLGRMARLLERQGDLKQALDVARKQRALADSIFNLARVTEIANLQANYQLQRSRTDVERLRFLNKEQQNREIIVVGIAASVALILIVLVYFYIRTRAYNMKLYALNEELKASNAVKDKMFSIIGHDLRAPLATMRNFLYALEEDALTPEERAQVVRDLAQNTDVSLTVLNQLLNWGQLQIKGMLLNPVTFNAAEIISNNIALVKNSAADKGITVYRLTAPDITLHADPDHFDLILRNLLSNAVKFTPDGGKITLGNNVVQPDGFISFYVEDTGIGMDPDHVKHIFDRTTVSTAGTRGEKGTALGMLMCKEYVEANGGTLSVKSEKGVGTTFTFTLKAG